MTRERRKSERAKGRTGGRTTRSRSPGFTLLEVLLALVIMVAAIAVVAQGFTAGTRAATDAKSETVAGMLADLKMADLETGEASLTQGSSGTFADHDGYKYKIDVEADAAVSGLTKVTVTVSWGEGDEERSVSLHRLMRERPKSP